MLNKKDMTNIYKLFEKLDETIQEVFISELINQEDNVSGLYNLYLKNNEIEKANTIIKILDLYKEKLPKDSINLLKQQLEIINSKLKEINNESKEKIINNIKKYSSNLSSQNQSEALYILNDCLNKIEELYNVQRKNVIINLVIGKQIQVIQQEKFL